MGGDELEMPDKTAGDEVPVMHVSESLSAEQAWAELDRRLVEVCMNVYGSFLGDYGECEIDSAAPLDCLFAKIDEDNNGSISFPELLAWVTATQVFVKLMCIMESAEDSEQLIQRIGMTCMMPPSEV